MHCSCFSKYHNFFYYLHTQNILDAFSMDAALKCIKEKKSDIKFNKIFNLRAKFFKIQLHMKLVKSLFVLATLFTLLSCSPKGPSIVGVWKPTSMVLPDDVLKQPEKAKLINQTFELSKNTYYHFKDDNSFALESEKEDPNLKDATGTYSMDGNKVVIDIYNTKLHGEIIKLTDTEMHVKSTDQATIIYTKIKS